MRVGLPLAFANGPPPLLVLVLGLFIAGIVGSGLWRMRGMAGRTGFATNALLGFFVAFGLAGIFLAVVGLGDLFPATEQRTVVPAAISSNYDSRGNQYFDVRAVDGTEYWSAPAAWVGLRDGTAYACSVHIYLLLIRPTIVSCMLRSQ